MAQVAIGLHGGTLGLYRGYIGVILRGVFVGYHLLSHHFRNWNIPSFLNFMLPVLIATVKG